RALFLGGADDECLVQENGDRGSVEGYGLRATLLVLLHAGELERGEQQLVAEAGRSDRESQNVFLAEAIGDRLSLRCLKDGRGDQTVVIELKHRLQLRAQASDLLRDRTRRDIRARPNQLDRERKAPRGEIEIRQNLRDRPDVLFPVGNRDRV